MGAVVLDASVAIALIDSGDAHHAQAAARFRDHPVDDLILPASAYAEMLVRPAALGRVDEVRTNLFSLGLRVGSLDRESGEAAARLRARFRSLRLPDALVLGHAEAIAADVVLTTDRSWKRAASNVKVVG